MRQPLEAGRLLVHLRVGAVDAIHIGRLEHRLRADLGRAQHRGRIGGEERVAGAAGEDHDRAVVEMAQRALALVGFADLGHGERRHGAGGRTGALERGFEHERIHHRRQHAHGVAGRPRHALSRDLDPAQDVAAADHDAERHAERARGDEIGGIAVDRRLVDAERPLAAQGLARDFHAMTRR